MTLDNLESTIFIGNKTFKGALQIDNSPGSEKVTNGSFTGNATGWTLGAEWAYGTNAVAKSGAGTSTLSQDVSAVANEIYRVVYTTSGISGGSITVSIGGVSGTARTTNATFTEYITATGTGALTFTPASATAVTIDDVSVKRVGVVAADRVTAWVDDRGATAGKGALHVRTEDGTSHVFGDRVGIGTAEPSGLLHLNSSGDIDQYISKGSTTNVGAIRFFRGVTGDWLIGTRETGTGNDFSIYSYGTGGDAITIVRSSGVVSIRGASAYADNGQLLEVNKSADDGGIGLFCWSTTDAERPLLEFHKSASATIGTKALVADEEAIGGIIWKAADGATNWQPAASIEGFVDTTPGVGDMGGRLVLSTTADGASSVTERLRIDSAGYILINTSERANTLGKLQIMSDAAKTANDGIMFFRSNEALASGPLELRISQVGNATAANQAFSIQLGHYGVDAIANLVLQTTGGNVGIGMTIPVVKFQVDDVIGVSNDAEGSTAHLNIRSTRVLTAALSGATVNMAFQIPSGAMILGAQFNVNTLIEGATSWSAAFNTGSTTSLGSGYALTLDTKVNKLIVPEITTNLTDITLTAAGSNFTAGVIECVVYYIDTTAMANA